jgi:large subunit ribosomal protein L9
MKVILTRDVKDLGKAGQVVNVAEGYGRNYLIPRKLAILAVEGAMGNIEKKKKFIEVKGENIVADAQKIAEKLKDIKVIIKGKAGTGTKLYGSVTAQDIAEALMKQHHITVDKRKIHMTDHIKNIGTYEAPIKLHHDVTANIHVEVVSEQEK